MEENKKQYLLLLSEIVTKMSVVFGDIAILRARSVTGLVVDNKGNIISIKGDAVQALKELIASYVELSGQAVKSSIDEIFIKYPQVKKI